MVMWQTYDRLPKKVARMPRINTRKMMLASPGMARKPKTDNTHKTSNTVAICLAGVWSRLIIQTTIKKMSKFTRVMGWRLKENKTTCGMAKPGIAR